MTAGIINSFILGRHKFAEFLCRLSCVFFIIFISGCSGGSSEQLSSETGSIAFNIALQDEQTTYLTALAMDGPSEDCQAAGVDTIRVEIYDGADSYLTDGGPWPCSAHKGSLQNVPEGSDRKIVILCEDSYGNVRYMGEHSGITVTRGKTSHIGTVVTCFFIPSLSAPANGSNVTGDAVTLAWDEIETAKEYRIVVSKNSDLGNPIVDQSVYGTSFAFEYLSESEVATYYWQVHALDSVGSEGAGSEIWSFTTVEVVTTTFYSDADGDGYGNAQDAVQASSAPDGYVSDSTDCDDSRSDVYPGATEVCDGVDNDCDNDIDEGVTTTFYRDADDDGYGNAQVTVQACSAPDGYVSDSADCDDSRSDVYPGATEVCDGVDNDCDNDIDEGVTTTFYRDADDDGYGNAQVTVQACSAPDGYVSDSADCDDSRSDVYPGAVEIINDNIDQNCDGSDMQLTDINLESAIRNAINKPTGDILESDLEGLSVLDAAKRGIKNIEGLQYCSNLTNLNLSWNDISDISPLSALVKLADIDLSGNKITDITALSGLTELINLSLSWNQVVDISPLVDNISIDNGDYINLIDNPLNTTSCAEYIPQLEDRGVQVDHICSIFPIATIQGALYNYQVAMSPDGAYVIVGDEYQNVVTFAMSDGTILWQYALPEGTEMESGAISTDGKIVVVGGESGSVFGLSSQGTLLWEVQEEVVGEVEVAVTDAGDKVFFGAQQKLFCCDGDGKLLWDRIIDTREWTIWDVSTSFNGDQVLLRTNSDIIVCDDKGNEIAFFDIVEGNYVVSGRIASYGSQFVVNFVDGDSYYVALYSIISMQEIWRKSLDGYGDAAIDSQGNVFVTVKTGDNYLWDNQGNLLSSWSNGGVNIDVDRDGDTCIVGRFDEATVYDCRYK